jgi:rod shape-determining protein MreB
VVIAVPSGVTEVEERTVINAAIEAGARRVYLIEEPMAAALGANMDISGPTGHMVVDIGAGTTDTAVLTMNSIATSSSIQVAGDNFDEAIARYVRRYHGVTIGLTIAEDIKINIGNLYPQGEDTPMTVLGRDVKTGMPRELSLTSSDIREVLYRLARQICDDVLSVLENTSPELVSDVARNGIVLTGGGCQLRGMDQLLSERTGVRCTVADDPASCVVFGCGKSLASINKMREGPINIARKRILKG